jgi:hypothetical protein
VSNNPSVRICIKIVKLTGRGLDVFVLTFMFDGKLFNITRSFYDDSAWRPRSVCKW